LPLLSTFGIKITCALHFHAVIVGNLLQLWSMGRPLHVCTSGRAAGHGASGLNTKQHRLTGRYSYTTQ